MPKIINGKIYFLEKSIFQLKLAHTTEKSLLHVIDSLYSVSLRGVGVVEVHSIIQLLDCMGLAVKHFRYLLIDL